MHLGRQVRLYLVDGSMGGLLTAEIVNWTGHLVAAPRTDIVRLLKRDEPKRTGVYILVGDNLEIDSAFDRAVYIGEGDDISNRLKFHAKLGDAGGKDFWDRVVVITSKDANITKAHARYLEARLIGRAHAAGRAAVTNVTAPTPLPLPEADMTDMEYFLSQIDTLLPVLGITELKSIQANAKPPSKVDVVDVAPAAEMSPVFKLSIPTYDIEARAQEIGGEFVVLAGSTARDKWSQHGANSSRALHDKLLANGTLSLNGGRAVFTSDTAFKSPSAAASVISGHSANGRISWKHESTGETFGGWQAQGVDTLDDE